MKFSSGFLKGPTGFLITFRLSVVFKIRTNIPFSDKVRNIKGTKVSKGVCVRVELRYGGCFCCG